MGSKVMLMTKHIAIATTAILGTLGAGGAAIAIAASNPGADASATGVGNAVKAARTAAGEGSGRPYDIERDRQRGNAVWEVDVTSGSGRSTELVVSADGKKIVRRGTSRRSDDANLAGDAKVSLATALRTAGGRASGKLEDADIDREGGRLVWTATFERRGSETEVLVNAKTGKVVDVITEREDEDDDQDD